MKYCSSYIIYTLAFVLTMTFVACQQYDEEVTQSDGTGTLVLSLGDAGLYTELQTTRAETPVADLSKYVFTLNGTTISGATIKNLELDVNSDDCTAQVNAGTYTITADNRIEANRFSGSPWYRGTSKEFTITINQTTPVSISLGKPKNARISMAIHESFSALYADPVLTLSDGERSQTLASLEDVCYFIIPASGALSYTISANAIEGSHATDMISATGYVDIQAGYNTTITLKAHPATGVIIPIVGEYNEEFNVKGDKE